MKENAKILEILTSLSKQRGFIFQSSEIYGGLGSTWDYGPLGVELKRNIKNLWWKDMITSRNNVVGMDASILMHPKVWEASGHVENFHDPLVDNKISKKRYRLDHLLEDQSDDVVGALLNKLNLKEGTDSEATLQAIVVGLLANEESSGALIIECGVIDPHTKEVGDWTNTRQFNLMFKTHIGPVADSTSID
jgi:glycyl-tRNA synthetase